MKLRPGSGTFYAIEERNSWGLKSTMILSATISHWLEQADWLLWRLTANNWSYLTDANHTAASPLMTDHRSIGYFLYYLVTSYSLKWSSQNSPKLLGVLRDHVAKAVFIRRVYGRKLLSALHQRQPTRSYRRLYITERHWCPKTRDISQAREEWGRGRGQMLWGQGRGQKKIVRSMPDAISRGQRCCISNKTPLYGI